MARLSDKQAQFTYAVTDLLMYARAIDHGDYRIRIDYAKRCDGCPVSDIEKSNHRLRLAIDLICDRFNPSTGYYDWQAGYSDFLSKLGHWWLEYGKKFDLPTAWGGEWHDYGHFSFEHNGVR